MFYKRIFAARSLAGLTWRNFAERGIRWSGAVECTTRGAVTRRFCQTTSHTHLGDINEGKDGGYKKAYTFSIESPNEFWMEAAEEIDWYKKPSKAIDQTDESINKSPNWFQDGIVNICFNALDRHILSGKGTDIALIYDSPVTKTKRKYTFSQLLNHVARLATVMKELGIEPGDRVLIYMPMIPEAVIGMLACARIGAVHSVVFGGFPATELVHRLAHSTPRLVLTASCGLEKDKIIPYKPIIDAAISQLQGQKPEHCIIVQRREEVAKMNRGFDLNYAELMRDAMPSPCVPVSSCHPLYILYTSGTTGKPKGVIRDTGGYAVALQWTMKNIYAMDEYDVFWAASDVGWVVGHSYMVYGPLLNGCTTILYEGKPVGTPDAGAFWRVIHDHKVNALFTAPTAIRAIKKEDSHGHMINDYDLSSLRALFLAGERGDPDTVKWCEHHLKIPVVDHYWQTETGWPIVSNFLGLQYHPTKHGSSTLPVPGFDVRILDEIHGKEVERGKLGDIVVKTPLPPGCFPSLWNDHEGFLKTYFAAHPGYYSTGDAGFQDHDGYIHIMTRTDDVINVAGHRLSTGAMEEIIAGHPCIAEVAVIGIKDELKGQIPIGFVVLKKEYRATVKQEDIERELVQLVRTHQGAIACFKTALIVENLPKTRSGKILRKTMRHIADGEPWNMPHTIEDPSVLNHIAETLQHLGLLRHPTT